MCNNLFVLTLVRRHYRCANVISFRFKEGPLS